MNVISLANQLGPVGWIMRWWKVIAITAFLAAMTAWHQYEVHESYKRGKDEVQGLWEIDKAHAKMRAAVQAKEIAVAQQESTHENFRRIEADAAAARAASGAHASLQHAFEQRSAAACPRVDAAVQATRTDAELLAYVQRRIDEAAGVLATTADERLTAGLGCEREYAGVQRVLNQPMKGAEP